MTTYVNLDNYKIWADIKSPNQDAKLNQLIAPACEMIQEYLGFNFTIDENTLETVSQRKSYKYLFQHDYDCDILLPDWNTQIVSIELFLKQGDAGSTPLPEVVEGDYYVNETTGVLHMAIPVSDRWGMDITYDNSYDLDSTTVLATYMLIDYWKDKNFESTVSQQSGNFVTRTPVRVLPKHIESMLNAKRGI